MTNFQKPPISLKQKKFAPPTFRQLSQLRKRDQNTYATFFLSIAVFSVPRKTIENAAPCTENLFDYPVFS